MALKKSTYVPFSYLSLTNFLLVVDLREDGLGFSTYHSSHQEDLGGKNSWYHYEEKCCCEYKSTDQ